jgi:hypothetical protein
MDVEVSDSVALSRAVRLHVEGKLSQAVLEQAAEKPRFASGNLYI